MTRYLAALLTVAAVVSTWSSNPGAATQRVRTIPMNHQPIASRLLPDDQVVVIEGAPLEPSFTMTRDAELKMLSRLDEIVVIHQAKPQSFFVRSGTWLNTRVIARVMQTVRTNKLATNPGDVIEFEHDGGQLTVNGVTVRSATGVFFEPNARYLVTLLFHKRWEPVVMFELDDLGRLRPNKRRDGTTSASALHDMTLAEFVGALRQGAQQQ